MSLSMQVAEVLLKADVRTRTLQGEPTSPITQSMLDDGLIDEDDLLTTDGVAVASDLQQKIARLESGMPFVGRPKKNISLVNGLGWISFSLFNQKWVTNMEIVFVAKKDELVTTPQAETALRSKSKILFDRCTKGKFVQAYPHTLQGSGLSGGRWIYLADLKQEIFTAVQATYFDYVASRWPSVIWMIEDGTRPVICKVTQKVLRDGVAAIIAPIVDMRKPVAREDWHEERKKM